MRFKKPILFFCNWIELKQLSYQKLILEKKVLHFAEAKITLILSKYLIISSKVKNYSKKHSLIFYRKHNVKSNVFI